MLFPRMPILVWPTEEVVVGPVVVVEIMVIILVVTKVLMIVEWILIDTCNLRTLEVHFHLLGLLGMVQQVMGMVLPIMALVTGDMGMGVQTLAMEGLVVLPMATQTSLVLDMQMASQLPQGVHGMHKQPLVMAQLAMEVLGRGVPVALVVADQLVSHQMPPLVMEIMVMLTVVMVVVMDLMEVMVMQEVVVEVPLVAPMPLEAGVVLVESCREIWVGMEVDMVMLTVMEDMGHKWAMVVGTVGHKIGMANSSSSDSC